MRIIGGSARSRSLETPKGQDTRPTQALVREALFDMLQRDVQDATVLDLFAGSGALGLESLSRGAASAMFVEKARSAAMVVDRNIEKLGFGERATLLSMDWRQALSRLAAQGKAFDLVFLDPPYRLSLVPVLALLVDQSLLAPGAVLALEHGKGLGPEMASPFSLRRRRAYGDTEITLLQYEGDSTDA